MLTLPIESRKYQNFHGEYLKERVDVEQVFIFLLAIYMQTGSELRPAKESTSTRMEREIFLEVEGGLPYEIRFFFTLFTCTSSVLHFLLIASTMTKCRELGTRSSHMKQ